MKRPVTLIIIFLALFCAGVIIFGSIRAALISEIEIREMSLVSDTTNNSDFDAKLYEIAYSSPVASDKIGLWMEAILANDFETFSSNGKIVTERLAGRLSGWPLKKTVEIDLSNSPVTDEEIAKLGSLRSAEWIDLSGTKITEKSVFTLLKKAPKLRKLQIGNTSVSWSPELVDALVGTASLKDLELDENKLDPASLTKLKNGLSAR